MTKMHSFKVTLRVQNKAGVLARITILLRKFQINIKALHVEPIDDTENFSDIVMVIQTTKQDPRIVMLKTERLIPVIKATWEQID